ncbi:MAG TPA: hypothetical protein VII56_18740 [Rhizomicrobium sp.]
MVAIDSAQDMPATRAAETSHTGQIVLLGFLAASLLVAASLVLNTANGSDSGWHVAAEMVSRFSLLLFAAAMSVEPLARLIPLQVMQAAGRERGSLTLAFAAAAAVALFCVAAPSQLNGESMSAPAIAYCFMTAIILVVMLFSAHPTTIRLLGAPAWRALHRIATAYFWIAFTITGLEHLIGPHRPDVWYGFSLLLLVGTLLLRFTDSFVAHWRYRDMAEKVA